jgi:predicted ArsR family transcriptional regulator
MQEQINSGNQYSPADLRKKIIGALEDSRYEWRTTEGVAKEVGITPAQVRETLEDLKEEIVRSSVPDESGRDLYTTRRHYRQTHGLGSRILNALSDKVA